MRGKEVLDPGSEKVLLIKLQKLMAAGMNARRDEVVGGEGGEAGLCGGRGGGRGWPV